MYLWLSLRYPELMRKAKVILRYMDNTQAPLELPDFDSVKEEFTTNGFSFHEFSVEGKIVAKVATQDIVVLLLD